MYKRLEDYELLGFFVVVVLGILFHSLYDITGSTIVSLFAPINESIWEHLKLLFYPFTMYSLFEYYMMKDHYNRFSIYKFISVFIGIVLIVVIHYTYVGIVGKTSTFTHITTYILSTAISFYISYYLLSHHQNTNSIKYLGIILFIIMSIIFTIFTFFQPNIPLFEAPNKLSIISLLTLM